MSNEAFDKTCYTEGCGKPVFFRGFGRAICLSCYAHMLENGTFYDLTQPYRQSTIDPNPTQPIDAQLPLF